MKAIRVTIGVILLVTALLVGGFAMWRASMWRALERRITALRLAGEPMLPADIERPPIPDEENAADIFLEAYRLARQTRQPADWDLPYEQEDWSEENWRQVAAWIETREPFLDLLRKAVARPHLRLPGNPGPWDEDWGQSSPRCNLIALMRESQRVLLPAAHLHLDRPDGTEPAVRSLILLLDVLDRVSDDWLLDQSLRMGNHVFMTRTLEELARRPEFDAARARTLLGNRLAEIENRTPVRQALRHERVAILWLLRHPERLDGYMVGSPDVGGFSGTWIGTAFVWRNAMKILDLVDGCLAALDRPDHEMEDAVPVAYAAEPGMLDRICSLVSGWKLALSIILSRHLLAVTEARLARIGLALLEHRQETGAWPESLAVIAERMENGVPVDPYTGKPFLYERDGKTVRLISAGDGSGPIEIVTDGAEDPRLRWELTR